MGVITLNSPVFLDTCIFIYFIDENRDYIDVVTSIFAALDEGEISVVTSEITLLETLVIPLRVKDHELAAQYEELLSESSGLTLISLERKLLRQAAELRADLGIKTPDAIQLSAAMQAGCKTFITNDRRMPKIAGLKILQLSDL